MSVFISYRSTDRDIALRLATDIRAAGYEVWFDRWNIVGRQPYWDEIKAGVESCSHFVFLVSPESIAEDSGALEELYHATSLRPIPRRVVCMVKLTPFKDFPIIISPGRYQIHDFVNVPYEEMLPHVLAALEDKTSDSNDPTVIQPFVDTYRGQKKVNRTLASALIFIVLLIMISLFGFGLAQLFKGNNPLPTATSPLVANEISPTATSTSLPTSTPTMTNTSTPVPPTVTNTPLSTNTAIPPTATDTLIPPTATDTPDLVIFFTPSPTIYNGSCFGFNIPSRLTIGMVAQVLPADVPNRLNTNPSRPSLDASSKIITDLPTGSTFTIVDGPTCNNDILWWKVNYKGMLGWTGEGQGNEYWVEPISSSQ